MNSAIGLARESLYGNGGDTLMYRFQRVSPMEVSPYARIPSITGRSICIARATAA